MKALRIEGEFHWGFWSRYPGTSKVQSSLPLPPPTSLIGALAYSLYKLGFMKSEGEMIIRTEGRKKDFLSPAILLENLIATSSIYFLGNGFPFDDINKHITLHFQTTTVNYTISEKYVHIDLQTIQGLNEIEKIILERLREEGYSEFDSLKRYITAEFKDKGITPEMVRTALSSLENKGIVTRVSRRMLPEYRTGAIIVGKTYAPSRFVAAYLIKEETSKILGENWERKLELAGFNIIRIGSKESIASINDSRIVEAREVKDVVKTKFYFPSSCAIEITEPYYREYFWKGGWGRETGFQVIEYVIPGRRAPLESIGIEVKLSPNAKAYEIAPQEVLIFE